MNRFAHRREASTEGTSVLQFPRLVAEPNDSDALSAPDSLPEFFDQLKTSFDALVTEAYINQLLSGVGTSEGPFDAVYISSLQPDTVEEHAVTRIYAFADIKDVSDEIRFDDEWAD